MLGVRGYEPIGDVIKRATSLDRGFSYRRAVRFSWHSVRWKPSDARISLFNEIILALFYLNYFFIFLAHQKQEKK